MYNLMTQVQGSIPHKATKSKNSLRSTSRLGSDIQPTAGRTGPRNETSSENTQQTNERLLVHVLSSGMKRFHKKCLAKPSHTFLELRLISSGMVDEFCVTAEWLPFSNASARSSNKEKAADAARSFSFLLSSFEKRKKIGRAEIYADDVD